MNAEDFDKIVGARLNWCEKTLCAKGDEYARDGDRLWNFKAAGRKRNQHPAQALAGMEVKHDVSVDDIIDGLARGIVPPKELVAEKIGDSINYLLLLEGLIEEERQRREGVPEMNAAFKAQGLEAMDTLASACGYIIPQMDDGGDDAYSGNISRPGCGRAFPLGTKQAERVQLYGVCVTCKYKTRPVPQADKEGPIMEASAEEYAALVRERQTAAESSGYTLLPPLDDGDDDPAVHVVPDRTSRSADDATAGQMYERHKREMEQYRSND